MEEYHKSPIERLGYRGWPQYSIFKHHLRVPQPYLKVIVKNYRDLTEVPILLSRLVEQIDKHLWSKMSDTEMVEKNFKVKGIPVPYIRDDSAPIGGVKVINAYNFITGDILKFLGKPMTLFMHSPFENSALKAASNIIKAGLRAGVDSRMVSFGKFLEETKTWNRDNFVVQSVEKASLLCLYMVGTEYTTEFSQSSLQTLLKTRRVAGQTTMICSHLEPAEFIKRYGFDPGAVPLKFEDEKLLSTIDELLKHMKG